MRRKKNPSGNLKFASLFSLLVIGLIILSLTLKLFLLVGNSKFDGVNSLTVLVKKTGLQQVINFSPKNQSIYILNLENIKDNPSLKYEIPIDAVFKDTAEITSNNLSKVLFGKIFDFKDQRELIFTDFLRLFLFANTVREPNFTQGKIASSSSPKEINKITSSVFVDPSILNDKESIEVINATDTAGLGNRLGNLISNIGGNVILVTTGEVENQSRIEYVNNSYTARRLSTLLNFRLKKTEKKSIPDIIIIIGKDRAPGNKF